jgi:hypothetical protein
MRRKSCPLRRGLRPARAAFFSARRPLLRLTRPLRDRLPMCPYAAGDFRLAIALVQQPRRLHPPLLQSLKVPAHSRWIAHAGTLL